MKSGSKVAAITPPPPGATEVPPMWSVYLASSDVEATARAIDAAGGKVAVGPMAIPGNGSMLYAFDPAGAAFGAWQGAEHIGSDVYNETGAMCWAEVHAHDPVATDGFYRSVFGFHQEQLGDGDTFDYTFWTVPGGDGPVAGRMKLPAEEAARTPLWLVYYAVDDADAAASRVESAGGSVMQEPTDSPYGRVAIVADPHGAMLAIIDLSRRSDPMA
jgi:predicted enzyme related to lactoylglutathione lyase